MMWFEMVTHHCRIRASVIASPPIVSYNFYHIINQNMAQRDRSSQYIIYTSLQPLTKTVAYDYVAPRESNRVRPTKRKGYIDWHKYGMSRLICINSYTRQAHPTDFHSTSPELPLLKSSHFNWEMRCLRRRVALHI